MSRRTSSGSRFQPLEVEGDDENSSSDSSVHSMRLSRDFYPQNAPIAGMSPIRKPSRRSSSHTSDGSIAEMSLSRDFYPQNVPIAGMSPIGKPRRRSSSVPSDQSIAEMSLSRDFYPQNVPISGMSPIGKPRRHSSAHTSDESIGEMRLSRDFYAATVPTAPRSGSPQLPGVSGYSPSVAGPSGTQRSSHSAGGSSGFSSFERKFKAGSRSMGPRSRTGTQDDPDGLQFVWDHYKRESIPYEEVGVDALQDIFSLSSDSEPEQIEKSKNVAEDVQLLRGVGFNIHFPDGKLGEGFYGVVYSGTYGMGSGVGASNRFAVKVIEFGAKNDSFVMERREKFETEKYILSNAFHRNIVSIRMIINMGDIKSFPYKNNPQERYLSPDRVYIIMDFADYGDFEGWFNKNYKTYEFAQRLNFIRDLFAGLMYLHSENIVHGDVHAGNVLLFSEMDGIVAKWTDFGLGYVGADKQYRYHTGVQYDMTKLFKLDIKGMHAVFWAIMKDRHLGKPETEEEKPIAEEVLKMLRLLKKDKTDSLIDVYNQFKHILEDELILDEQHFQ